MKHTNKIAILILNDEYSDYHYNSYHYDREYKMLVKARELALPQAVVMENIVKNSRQLNKQEAEALEYAIEKSAKKTTTFPNRL